MIERADIPLGAGAMTVPLWITDVHPWLVEFGLWGGGILLAYRLVIVAYNFLTTIRKWLHDR